MSLKGLSDLNKYTKDQLIDWFINTADPNVMLKCLVNKLEKTNNKSLLADLKNLIDEEQKTSEEEEVPKKKKSSKKSIDDIFNSLMSKNKELIKNTISELKEKQLVSIFNKIVETLRGSSKSENRQYINEHMYLFKKLRDNIEDQTIKTKLNSLIEKTQTKTSKSKTKSGFGQFSLQSNRRHSKKKNSRKLKKNSKSLKSKTRKSKTKGSKTKGSKSKRKSKVSKRSKRKSKGMSKTKKSSFGKMYGLQNGPAWNGVFPMDLNVVGSLPTLLFGKSKKQRSRRKSKIAKRARKSKSNKHSRRGARKSAKRSRRGARKSKSKRRGVRKSGKRSFGKFNVPRSGTLLN